MATALYYNPFIPAYSNVGVAIGGAKLYFYSTGTTNLATVYSDSAGLIPLSNPVLANLAGKYVDIYLDSAITYKLLQTDANDVPLGNAVDPYVPGTFSTAAGAITSGTLNAARLPAFTGDITTTVGASVTTIAAGAVTLAKQANIATSSLVYRKTAGTGAPEIQSLATLKTDLGLTNTNSGDQTITLTGDATGTGTGSFAVTIPLFTSSVKGLAPPSGGGTANYLRADGAWAAPTLGAVGSTWTHPEIAPPLTAWFPTTANTPTITDYTGYGLGITGAASGSAIRYAVKTALAADTTIIARVLPNLIDNNTFCGIVIRDSVGGKCLTVGTGVTAALGTPKFIATQWTNSTTLLSEPTNTPFQIMSGPVWIKVVYVFATKTVTAFYSYDSKTWHTALTANTFVTAPDQLGVGVWSTSAGTAGTNSDGVAAGVFTYWTDGTNNGTPLQVGGAILSAFTFNNLGSGAVSGTTFDGSVARTLSYNSIGAAPLAGPVFTGVPQSTTAAVDTNTVQIATTAFVIGQAYAKLASPVFTGNPASTTAAVDTNTTQIATTAFVIGQAYAKLVSPAFTGTPTAPTATYGTSTTQLATTAFVDALRDIPANPQTAAYTLALTDRGKYISITTGGVVIPANASIAFGIGSVVSLYNDSGVNQAISITTDTLYLAGSATTGARTLAQHGIATLLKVSATVWVVSGAGVT